jgi:hypothetical protein
LKEAFASARVRSASWGSDALKRLSLSLPKASNFIPDNPLSHKPRKRVSSMSQSSPSPLTRPAYTPSFHQSSTTGSHTSISAAQAITTESLFRQPATGRNGSIESTLYHTVSRASSLGDDSRFWHQREQVNSRGQALRDTLHDKLPSSMPSLPRIPSMPRLPSFTLAMNFTYSFGKDTPPVKWNNGADSPKVIMPGTVKKRSTTSKDPLFPESANASLPDLFGTESNWEQALTGLTGDVIIMGGYRGSILRSTATNRQVWAPVKVCVEFHIELKAASTFDQS